MTANIVFDAWALVALLKGEAPAAQRVYAHLSAVVAGTHQGFITLINLGEVYHICGRLKGGAWANQKLLEIRSLPLTITAVDEQTVLQAATYKMTHPISYADAFALTCAIQHNALLVTGDPELVKLATLVPIDDLRN